MTFSMPRVRATTLAVRRLSPVHIHTAMPCFASRDTGRERNGQQAQRA